MKLALWIEQHQERAAGLLLVPLLVVVLAGCSGGGDATAKEDKPVATPSSAPEVDGHNVLTAVIVMEGFKEAKLPVREQRDNSRNCESLGLGCIELVTTDDLSIYTFGDPAVDPAEQQALTGSLGGEAYSSGNVVLSYAAAHTSAALRPKYQKVLDGLK